MAMSLYEDKLIRTYKNKSQTYKEFSIPDAIRIIETWFRKLGDNTKINPDDFIFLETKRWKHIRNVMQVFEYISAEELKDQYYDLDKAQDKNIENLNLILERLYDALNTSDDIPKFILDHPISDFDFEEDVQIREGKGIPSYPDVNIEAIIHHPEVDWMFKDT